MAPTEPRREKGRSARAVAITLILLACWIPIFGFGIIISFGALLGPLWVATFFWVAFSIGVGYIVGKQHVSPANHSGPIEKSALITPEECIEYLGTRGYAVAQLGDRERWIIHEPLGGRETVRSLEELREYAASR